MHVSLKKIVHVAPFGSNFVGPINQPGLYSPAVLGWPTDSIER